MSFLKAFSEGIESSKDITVSGGSISPAQFGFDVDWGNPNYTKLVDLAAKNPLARRAISFIGENMGAIPIKLVEVQSNGEEVQVEDHELLQLLSRPGGPNNPRYNKEWLFRGKVWAMMGGGEYWLESVSPDTGTNAGMPRKLRLYNERDFNHFTTDREGFISGYNLSLQLPYGTKPIQEDTDTIMHAFNFHPKRRNRGLPILISCFRAMSLMEDADNWNKNISKNKGQVPGWMMPRGLEPGDQIDPNAREQAQEQVDEKVNKGRKGNKWTVLGGAFEPMSNNITPKEASFLDSMEFYGRMIAAVLGIDPIFLASEQAKTYNNYKTALIIAYVTRIIPMFEFFLSNLNRHVTPKFEDAGQTLKLTFDPMMINAMREAMLEKIETLTEATGTPILTADEARNILGYEPKGIESIIMKMNLATHEQVAGGPQTEIDSGIASINGKTDEEIVKDVEEIINGEVETDKYRETSNGHV